MIYLNVWKRRISELNTKKWISFYMSDNNPLSLEEAFTLCKKYRDDHKVRLFSQCWGCLKYCKEESIKMCFYHPPDNHGCKFVNQLFDTIH